jgi:hypothetical protein
MRWCRLHCADCCPCRCCCAVQLTTIVMWTILSIVYVLKFWTAHAPTREHSSATAAAAAAAAATDSPFGLLLDSGSGGLEGDGDGGNGRTSGSAAASLLLETMATEPADAADSDGSGNGSGSGGGSGGGWLGAVFATSLAALGTCWLALQFVTGAYSLHATAQQRYLTRINQTLRVFNFEYSAETASLVHCCGAAQSANGIVRL